ncbi:MAG: hypothetical protein ACE5JS_12980 [Nitrospinota bacterium]
MDLEAYRQRSEEFTQTLSREYYEGRAGLKERVNFVAIYEAYTDLFTGSVVESVRRSYQRRGATEVDETRRLALLLEQVTLSYISNQTRKLRQDTENFESAARVELPGGEKLPYRLSAVRLANEPERKKRQLLEDARRSIVLKKNDFLEPLHRSVHALAPELGYGSYLEMLGALKSYALGPVRDAMQTFLQATETLYEREMGKALKSIGARLDEARRHDVGYLFRAGKIDALFPLGKIVEAVGASVRKMGLDLTADGRVVLDLEERPTKSPRAFCVPIRVPTEVMLVILPRGGLDDYHAFLHELGHALHFAWVRPDVPYEYRRLGDNSVTEGFAMLFDHLLMNGLWLVDALGVGEPGPLLHHQYLYELYMLRRYAAKIDYELALHDSGDLGRKPEAYGEKLSGATRIQYSAAHYLDDVDAHFYCASYLRAWMLQAALAAELTGRFGERWFHDPRAGDLLKDLWAEGQKENAEGVLARLNGGKAALTPDALLAAIERHLR